MLNSILLHTLAAGKSDRSEKPTSMGADSFETPAHYRGWPFPLRYLLAIRYLTCKEEVLKGFALRRVFPIPQPDFSQQLRNHLGGESCDTLPWWAWLFKFWVIYPLLLTLILGSVWGWQQWQINQRFEQVIKQELVVFAELNHRRLAYHFFPEAEELKQLSETIKQKQQQIIAALPEKGELRSLFAKALKGLTNPDQKVGDIFRDFSRINQEMEQLDRPFYVVPKSFTDSCNSFTNKTEELKNRYPFISEWEELEEAEKLSALFKLVKTKEGKEFLEVVFSTCRTTMLFTYRLVNKRLFQHKSQPLPLFHTQRLDPLPITESALGLTYDDTPGSLILQDNIQNFATKSVLPALISRGRYLVLPYWFHGGGEVDQTVGNAFRDNLEALLKDSPHYPALRQSARDLVRHREFLDQIRLSNSLLRMDAHGESVTKDDWLGSGLDALSKTLLEDEEVKKPPLAQLAHLKPLTEPLIRSIGFHEAYHQIKVEPWQEPDWVAGQLRGKRDKAFRKRVLGEMGAYLTELKYGDGVRHLRLSQILFFALNVLMKDEPEYYASHLILTNLGSDKAPSNEKISHKPLKLYEAYEDILTWDKTDLANAADEAHKKLLGRPIPVITTD